MTTTRYVSPEFPDGVYAATPREYRLFFLSLLPVQQENLIEFARRSGVHARSQGMGWAAFEAAIGWLGHVPQVTRGLYEQFADFPRAAADDGGGASGLRWMRGRE